MAKAFDKDFWEKEEGVVKRLFDKIPKEPAWIKSDLVKECEILQDFFLSKIFPEKCSPEVREQLESKAKDLGYSADSGVQAWFNKREKELKKNFHETRTKSLSQIRDKKRIEIACVKKFYKNNGQCLSDSQIPADENSIDENSIIDVTVVERDGKKTDFQVTALQEKLVGASLRGDIVSIGDETLEEIKCDILDVIKTKEDKMRVRKELKSCNNIILLLHCFPFSPNEELLERAVAELSINSSFKEIYIITDSLNIAVKKEV